MSDPVSAACYLSLVAKCRSVEKSVELVLWRGFTMVYERVLDRTYRTGIALTPSDGIGTSIPRVLHASLRPYIL